VLKKIAQAFRQALDDCENTSPWLLQVEMPTLRPPWDVPEEYAEFYFASEEADPGEEDDSGAFEEGENVPLLDPSPGPMAAENDALLCRLRRSYAGAVTFLDKEVGVFLDQLEGRGLLEETLLLMTADCGFPLGEHGWIGTGQPWLHEELVHLPLIVRLPGAAEAGRRIGSLTQPVDFLPTFAEALAFSIPPTQGHSLLPLCHGDVESLRRYACSGLDIGEAVVWALRSPQWAFLTSAHPSALAAGRGRQLFVKPDDHWEVNNVLQHHLELAEKLDQTLQAFVRATHHPGPLHIPALPELEPAREATAGTAAISHGEPP
jgi:arylsulfatase A-like enzyme